MIPEPRSRLCFWIGAALLLAAPFGPDLFREGGGRDPWILSWEGRGFILPILVTAAAALTGGWDRSRESPALSWLVSAWGIGFSIFFVFWASSDRRFGGDVLPVALWLLVSAGCGIAWFGALLSSRDPESVAAMSRAACGILFAARAVDLILAGSAVGYQLAAGGTALLLGEIFEKLAAREKGLLVR